MKERERRGGGGSGGAGGGGVTGGGSSGGGGGGASSGGALQLLVAALALLSLSSVAVLHGHTLRLTPPSARAVQPTQQQQPQPRPRQQHSAYSATTPRTTRMYDPLNGVWSGADSGGSGTAKSIIEPDSVKCQPPASLETDSPLVPSRVSWVFRANSSVAGAYSRSLSSQLELSSCPT